VKNKKEYSFNYWPSFTDVLITVVFILIMFFFLLVLRVYQEQLINFNEIREMVMKDLRDNLDNDANIIDRDTLVGTNHTIIFKESFLFKTGEDVFKDSKSENLIRIIGRVLNKYVKSGTIARIVVEGHTNSIPITGDKYGNWTLSTNRAVRVVKTLDEIGILNFIRENNKHPSRVLSVAGYSQYDFVQGENGNEDLEASKRIQIFIEYQYRKNLQ